jgi:CheY-like chemotaxis protein
MSLPDLQGFTILVVEDDRDTADLVVTTLQACGANVYAAHVTQQARTLLGEVRPQAVVCDLALPGEDGIAFAAWIRQQPHGAGGNTAIIAYTAHDVYYGRAPGAGFAAIVKKPSDPRQLCDIVADVLKGPRATRGPGEAPPRT